MRIPQREQGFNPHIQGARGLFAGMVFLFHVLSSRLPAPAWLDATVPAFFAPTLQFGVEMFFCISGFVIAGTLRRARSPMHFILDRAIRILPVLWATMPVVIGLEYAARWPDVYAVPAGRFLSVLAANLFCLPGLLPLPLLHFAAWTLSYEMGFYAICTLAWCLRRHVRPAILLPVPVLVLLLLYPRAVFFLVGLAVAEGWADRSAGLRWCSRFPSILLLVFLGLWGSVFHLNNETLQTTAWGWWNDRRLVFALAAAITAWPLFLGIADGAGMLGRILRSAAFQWLGRVSYSLYLWQILVMAVAKRALYLSGLVAWAGHGSMLLFGLLALPPTLAVAWLSQRWIERGLSERLRRWLDARAPRAA